MRAAAMAERAVSLPHIRDVDVRGRTVLVRADLNVPMHNGAITDPGRVKRFAPTVAELVSRGASVVVIGHLGRPDGVANPTLSLKPVAEALAEALGQRVIFVPDCVGAVAEQVTRTLPAGAVAVLENLRYHQEEEAGDRSFALLLSVHGDFYVNDMPGLALRSRTARQASIHALSTLMPAFAGPLLVAAQSAVPSPQHPDDTLEET